MSNEKKKLPHITFALIFFVAGWISSPSVRMLQGRECEARSS